MSNLSPLSLSNAYAPASRLGPIDRRPGSDAAAARVENDGTTARGTDQVELSFSAQVRGRTAVDSTSSVDQPIRADLVSRVRAEIAAGTYETPEKLDIAIGRALSELA